MWVDSAFVVILESIQQIYYLIMHYQRGLLETSDFVWASWRLGSPATRMFDDQFLKAYTKKVQLPLTKGRQCREYFDVMAQPYLIWKYRILCFRACSLFISMFSF